MESRQPCILSLPDGRSIAYSTYGISLPRSPHAPIIYFHGFPSSRIEAALWHTAAEELRVHLIAVDRPGMGCSTFQAHRNLLDWPDDIIALANHLNLSEFGVLGASAGGPYVLACLHALPKERLRVAAAVCGVYPFNLGTSGMLFTAWALIKVAMWAPWLTTVLLDWKIGHVARDIANPDRFIRLMKTQLLGEGLPQVDTTFLRTMSEDPVKFSTFAEAVREGFKESSRGTTCEGKILGEDWGFSLDKVDGSRLIMWHGTLDSNVPIRMADKAAAIIHPVVYRRVENEGHSSLGFGYMEEVLKSIILEMGK